MDVGVYGQSDFDQRILFLFAQNDADRRSFVFQFHKPVEVIDVHLHLAEIAVAEFADLEIDQHIAAQQAVVEHQIDEEMFLVESEALLPGLEQKSLAQYQPPRPLHEIDAELAGVEQRILALLREVTE